MTNLGFAGKIARAFIDSKLTPLIVAAALLLLAAGAVFVIDTLDPDAAARQLVDAANMNGGEDNISVIVARVPDLPPPLLASWLKTWLVRNNNH